MHVLRSLLLTILHELLHNIHLRVYHLLPVTIDPCKLMRGLLKDSIDNIELLSELPLADCQLELHLLDFLALFRVDSDLVCDILAYDCD